jgi:sialic acid synthase SpsE
MMSKTYIIAEMAWGYTGDYKKAVQMLNGIKESGGDAVGIHITSMADYMVEDYKCIAGQTLSDSADESIPIYEFLEQINMSDEEWLKFGEAADDLGVDLVVMCNDIPSFKFSEKLNVKKYVVASAIFLEFELIQQIVEENNDLILRVGGATLAEIETIIEFILSIDRTAEMNLLVGIQMYPTPINQLNIASIETLRQHFDNSNITFGLADHIDGDDVNAIYLPALALSYGITSIEKHITTDRKDKLEDYEAALGIEQFKRFVDFTRVSEKALGDGSLNYLVNDSYVKYRDVVRKKIVALKDLNKGETVLDSDITFKRADYGEQLENKEDIIGKRLMKDVKKDEGLCVKDVV